MKQNKSIIIFLSLMLAGMGFAMKLTATGPIQMKNVQVNPFTDLTVRTQFDVYLSQGDEEKLVIETYKSIIPYVNVKQTSDGLVIALDRKVNRISWLNRDKILKLYITVKDLEELKLSGACDLYMQTDFHVGDLKIDASGASDLVLKKITGTNIKINTSGASDIKGSTLEAKTVYINASGASDANVHIKAPTVKLIASGSSDFNLDVNAESLNISAHGSSDFKVKGNSTYLKANLSGSSDLKASDLKTETIVIDASGSSDSRLYVTKSLTVSCSGASSVYYTGSPQQTSFNVSGISSIKSK